MKKLDILITRFPFESALGGEELHTLHLAESLLERGHDITLLTSDVVLTKLFEEKKLNVVRGAAVSPPVTILTLFVFTLLSPFYFLYLNWFLIKFHRQHKKDPKRADMQPVIYSLSLTEKLLMSPVAKLLGLHVVWIEHARIGGSLTKNPWIIAYYFWSSFSQIIAPSKQTAYPIRWAKNLHIIPHGIKFDKPSFKVKSLINQHDKATKKGHATNHKPKLLCVARLSQDKGVDYLISAILKLINHGQEIGLQIVGTGVLEESLKKTVKELHLDRFIEFKGKVPHDKLAKLYEESDVVVLPSSEHDPFGLVVLEGMMLSKPIVLTSACGVSEYLESGVEALVIPPKDDHALFQAIKALLTNQTLKAEIAKKGHATINSKFNYERMIDEYEKIFLKSI
ncbi:MAG: glycosyltransferase family 4 protein [Candidatus Peregrinibacteria bacterium]|nr:glycosyltransferase family 4 protein [Candidatus Peregrinibacteria bacterium]MDZ4244715.1 glycosyltransferase family 4 protein [Candidatus Gracilibacteria bacterium]